MHGSTFFFFFLQKRNSQTNQKRLREQNELKYHFMTKKWNTDANRDKQQQ